MRPLRRSFFTTTNPFNKYVDLKTSLTGQNFSLISDRKIPYRSFGISFFYKFGKLEFKKVKEEDNKRGLKCSKHNFWLAIRNPVYCGKIFVAKYKDEEERLAPGQHEGIISEELFQEVQDVLDCRGRIYRPKSHEQSKA